MEKVNTIIYNVQNSADRIDKILSSGSFTDRNSVPTRDSLTFENGFYVYVTALFIDIVGSSEMTDEHYRPTLAKIYRFFISECTAIMNSEYICKEINIHGDCVWGVFDTPKTYDIDTVFSVSAKLSSLIDILNYKLSKKNYSGISVGIGMDYGRALMVKAGYSGSSLNDVIWMGDVVNSASHIASKAGRNYRDTLLVSSVVHNNLNDHNKGLLSKTSIDYTTYYGGNIHNIEMNNWYKANCK